MHSRTKWSTVNTATGSCIWKLFSTFQTLFFLWVACLLILSHSGCNCWILHAQSFAARSIEHTSINCHVTVYKITTKTLQFSKRYWPVIADNAILWLCMRLNANHISSDNHFSLTAQRQKVIYLVSLLLLLKGTSSLTFILGDWEINRIKLMFLFLCLFF